MMAIFEERQGLSRFVVAAILSGSLIFGIVIVILQVAGADAKVVQMLWGVWLVMALIDWAIASLKMVTEVHPDGVVVSCRPLRFLRRKIAWDAIAQIYARQYSPLGEYGGWGIRLGKSGTAYNMRGDQGIQLELKNGKRILIGTQQPEAFMEAVRSAGGEFE